jgi:predicted AAA+ superfamily ATPase
VSDEIPVSPRLTVAELCSADGEALLLDMRIYGPALQAALERYLRFGGLPAAVAEAASGAQEPSREVRRVLYDSLVRELQRRGASVPAGSALLERVVRSLGAKVSWSAMAREMDVPLVCGPRRELDVVEVKYREHPTLSAASAAARAHPGRPVVMVTKNVLRAAKRYTLIPAHLLLRALG